jgi:3-deoxy-7-phosphoheptulonate synthase
VGDREVGRDPIIIAGPCAVEDEEQMERVASRLAELGVTFLRGGAFKPRTSPYSFQGLGKEGLLLLESAGRRHGLKTVTEVVDTRTVDLVANHADMLQIGSRNQLNYELLKAVATTGKPILLKRGFAATLDELLRAAEYIVAGGNENVVLCERGIRTFARETRHTLDISAIPLLRELCRLPVIVDISHAAGRRDILPSLARASLAAGAHGIMVEVHPNPGLARSDAQQQLDLDQFERLLSGLSPDLLILHPRAAEQSAE